MAYQVKELFYSLQGEGANSGRASVFCRFAGCNLWSGREADRSVAACDFCDTDFVGGDKYPDAETLAAAILHLWPTRAEHKGGAGHKFVILTGGEPGLQVDAALIDALHGHGFEIAIESNGTQVLPDGLDWIAISPKAGAALVVTAGDELKVVYPQAGLDLASFTALDFTHFYVQPKDGPDAAQNVILAIDFCRAHPQWRLSLQTHKLLNIR
jgi:7-carboxy-7-deazaguanine synthase (Cx14CxxC type)